MALTLGACTSFGATRAGKEYTDQYNRAVAGQQATDALTLRESYRAARSCGDADYIIREHGSEELSTVNGHLSLKAASEQCRDFSKQLRHRPIEGCGVRLFTVSSNLQADGVWTPPTVVIPSTGKGKSYDPVECSRLTPPAPIPAEFSQIEAALRQECGADAQLSIDREWSSSRNAQGVVAHRERSASCTVKGTRSDWWLDP